MQVSAFMAMNAKRHVQGHADLFWHMANGEDAKAEAIETFYDEYFAVLDLAAEFYLETVKTVFQDHALARNAVSYRGDPIDLRAIRRTALMTVEGERDDICAVGPDHGGPRSLHGPRPLHADPSPPGRRRPLRRLRGKSLGVADLPAGAQLHPGAQLSPARRIAPI